LRSYAAAMLYFGLLADIDIFGVAIAPP
jgi:hypothetical protein